MTMETGAASIARRDERGMRTRAGFGSLDDEDTELALTATGPPKEATTEAIALRESEFG
mgnify:CR=1 FL=1